MKKQDALNKLNKRRKRQLKRLKQWKQSSKVTMRACRSRIEWIRWASTNSKAKCQNLTMCSPIFTNIRRLNHIAINNNYSMLKNEILCNHLIRSSLETHKDVKILHLCFYPIPQGTPSTNLNVRSNLVAPTANLTPASSWLSCSLTCKTSESTCVWHLNGTIKCWKPWMSTLRR